MTGLFSYPKRKLRKLITQGEYEKAEEFGQELEAKFSKDPDFLFIMGSMYYMLNDEDDSVRIHVIRILVKMMKKIPFSIMAFDRGHGEANYEMLRLSLERGEGPMGAFT